MRITVIESCGKRVNIRIPTRLLFNTITVKIVSKVINGTKDTDKICALKREDIRRIVKAVRLARKNFAGIPLVEVIEKDGEYVRIML